MLQPTGTNNAVPWRLSWKSPEPVSSHVWKTHPILSSFLPLSVSWISTFGRGYKTRMPSWGCQAVETGTRQAGAAWRDEKRRSLHQAKHVPKAQIANGVWDLCPQVQMSQMCQVLETAPQVAGTRSSLWRTVCYYTALLLQPLPAACPPFESGLQSMWCRSLGRASCGSPFASHLDCRGLEKQSYRVRRRLDWRGPTKVTPTRALSLLHFNRLGRGLAFPSQPPHSTSSDTASYPWLAWGFQMGLNSPWYILFFLSFKFLYPDNHWQMPSWEAGAGQLIKWQ